jgi:hypothetical protein
LQISGLRSKKEHSCITRTSTFEAIRNETRLYRNSDTTFFVSDRFRFIRVPEIRIFEGAQHRDCERIPLKTGFRETQFPFKTGLKYCFVHYSLVLWPVPCPVQNNCHLYFGLSTSGASQCQCFNCPCSVFTSQCLTFERTSSPGKYVCRPSFLTEQNSLYKSTLKNLEPYIKKNTSEPLTFLISRNKPTQITFCKRVCLLQTRIIPCSTSETFGQFSVVVIRTTIVFSYHIVSTIFPAS